MCISVYKSLGTTTPEDKVKCQMLAPYQKISGMTQLQSQEMQVYYTGNSNMPSVAIGGMTLWNGQQLLVKF